MTTLYVAMQDELLIASNRKGRWQLDHQLIGMNVQGVAVDPNRLELVYAATYGRGLWRSEDAGATWSQAGGGLAHLEVTAVAVSETERIGNHGIVWSGTEPSAIFRSEDSGNLWEEKRGLRSLPSSTTWSYPPRPWTHHVRWIEPDSAIAGRIFVCIEAGGVMRSLDSGENWEDRWPDGPLDAHTLKSHRLAPNRIYAAAGDGLSVPGKEYSESRDGGCTWHRLGSGLHHHYLWGLAIDPNTPDIVLVSASKTPETAHNRTHAESTIYRRSADGVWREIQSGLPDPHGTLVATLASTSNEPGVFYLASNRGIFRSFNAGLNWELLPIPWPERFFDRRPQGVAIGE